MIDWIRRLPRDMRLAVAILVVSLLIAGMVLALY
jgi:hypothetical protein